MKLIKPIIDGLKTAASAIGRGITYAAAAVGRFLFRNWKFIVAGLVALVAFAAVTAAIVFFWPAVIGAIAGLGFTLPLVGALSLGFLNTLAVPAAAAVIGAVAAGATFVAGVAIIAGIALVNKLDGYMQSNGTKPAKPTPTPTGDDQYDLLSFDDDEENDDEVENASSCFGSLFNSKPNTGKMKRRTYESHHGSPLGTPVLAPNPKATDINLQKEAEVEFHPQPM